MPRFALWSLAGSTVLGLYGCAAGVNAADHAPPPQPPAQPSAAFLEFIGDWSDAERELMMNKKLPLPTAAPMPPKPAEKSRAP
jgi:hypothetical protein